MLRGPSCSSGAPSWSNKYSHQVERGDLPMLGLGERVAYDNSMLDESRQESGSTSHSLIARAKQADAAAWERLTRLYSPVVFGWAKQGGLQADDAADVMQNVFQTLTARLHQFERRNGSDSFRGWLYTITRNKVRDHFRAKRSQAQPIGGTAAQEMWQHLPETPPDASSSDGNTELTSIRHRALELISGQFAVRTWQAFYRTAVLGDAPQDVASDLGISVWAVYKARSRVLTKLRTEFEDLLS